MPTTPPLVIPNGFAEYSFTHRLTGYDRLAVNTFGVQWADGSESLATQAASIMGFWIARVLPFMDTSVTLVRCVAIGRDSGGVLHRYDHNLSSAGSTAGAATTPNVALLVRKSSTLAGKQNRGRLYVGWCTEEGSVDETGQIAGATVTVYQTAFDALHADLATRVPNADMVILHREVDPGPQPAPTVVSSLNVESRIATQRRRLRK